MSIQELIDEFSIEVRRNYLGNAALPPIGLIRTVVKTDTTKLPGVGEDQRTSALMQNQVVVFAWVKFLQFDVDFARHAEMNSQPVVARKSEQHSFAARCRYQQFVADKVLPERACVHPTENAIPPVHAKIANLIADAYVPLFAIPFDFGQLWHRADYVARSCCRCEYGPCPMLEQARSLVAAD